MRVCGKSGACGLTSKPTTPRSPNGAAQGGGRRQPELRAQLLAAAQKKQRVLKQRGWGVKGEATFEEGPRVEQQQRQRGAMKGGGA